MLTPVRWNWSADCGIPSPCSIPGLPVNALDDSFRKVTRLKGSTLESRNRAFHQMLVNGVEVEYRDAEGRVRED